MSVFQGKCASGKKRGCNETLSQACLSAHSPYVQRGAQSAEKVRGSLSTPAITDEPWGLSGFGFWG